MPSTEFLESLVRLASAGTSGICIFAVFWSGFSLMRLPNDASNNRHVSLRYFMATCIVISVISAGTTVGAGYWDYKRVATLQVENTQLEDDKQMLSSNNQELKVEVNEKAAMVTRLNQSQIALTKELQTEKLRAAALSSELQVRDNRINSLKKEFSTESERAKKLETHIKSIQPSVDIQRLLRTTPVRP